MGGNVTVARGRDVGGDFAHIPACGSLTQTGCVVAYSSYSSKPPAKSDFGRVRSALVPLQAHGATNLQVMCVNPASPGGGAAPLEPYFPSLTLAFLRAKSRTIAPVATPWVAFPGEYTARCKSSGGATWLQVTHVGGANHKQPVLTTRDGALGLHVFDVNLALGNLVSLVRSEAAAYRG